MSRFTQINLAKLPAPEVIKTVDFEVLLAEMKAYVLDVMPELGTFLELESEFTTKLLEVCAYFRMLDRLEFNDGAKACMLALSTGTNLDGLAAYWGVERLVIQEANETVTPPIPQILETDEALRVRTQLSLEGHTSAGSLGSYVFWGLTASPRVKDVDAYSIDPGDTIVTILTKDDTGIADQALLDLITSVIETVRPLCATVIVQPATIIPLTIEATLTLYQGPDTSLVMAAANAALVKYLDEHHRLGHDITISGIHADLHQPGVQNVTLVSPAADVVVSATAAAFCDLENDLTLTLGGIDV